MESIISAYGYYALFLGTFIEGETIVLISGFLAHRGYLDIRLVMLVAWAGSFLGDQAWFYVGRWRGRKMLASRPKWQERGQRLRPMLEKHQVAVLLGFRFAVGFRIATPVILGSINYSALRFLFFNAIGAAAWAVILAMAGYTFGHAVELVIAEVHKYELWLAAAIVPIVGIVWVFRRWRRRRGGLAVEPLADAVKPPSNVPDVAEREGKAS